MGNGKINRRDEVLEIAASLFATRGYATTSIRDIAQHVGILSGSLYYHFASKEEILLEAHARGVAQAEVAVEQAIAKAEDRPWPRLAAACRAHLEILLGPSPFSDVLTSHFPRNFEGVTREKLLQRRDGYETIFRGLVEALPLPEGVNRRHLRLALLGGLNWTPTWYQAAGEDTPASIAAGFVDVLRLQLDPDVVESARGFRVF